MRAHPASAQGHGRFWVGLLPWAWMLFFFVLPFALIVNVSLSTPDLAVPPYVSPFAGTTADGAPALRPDPASYARLGDELAALATPGADRPYLAAYANSVLLAALTTLCCLLLGYPFAYRLARAPEVMRNTLLMLVMLPFWTSFLLRVYAWMGLLNETGLINNFLLSIGLISEPLHLFHNDFSLYLVMVYAYLPFMVLPLYAVLERQQHDLLEAAADLGCTPIEAFWRVTFPLSLPGVAAGSLLCFIPMVGEFVIPDLLGGSSTLMLGKTIWTEFFANRDWPAASAVAIVLLFTLVIPIVLYQRQQAKLTELG